MNNTVPYLPSCHLCKKPVVLELAKTDEHGRTVHEGCYLLNVLNLRGTSKPPLKA